MMVHICEADLLDHEIINETTFPIVGGSVASYLSQDPEKHFFLIKNMKELVSVDANAFSSINIEIFDSGENFVFGTIKLYGLTFKCVKSTRRDIGFISSRTANVFSSFENNKLLH